MLTTARPFELTHKPVVRVGCGKNQCRGILMRLTLSRIEEGLGHEGFQCDTCERRVKYVPRKEGK